MIGVVDKDEDSEVANGGGALWRGELIENVIGSTPELLQIRM